MLVLVLVLVPVSSVVPVPSEVSVPSVSMCEVVPDEASPWVVEVVSVVVEVESAAVSEGLESELGEVGSGVESPEDELEPPPEAEADPSAIVPESSAPLLVGEAEPESVPPWPVESEPEQPRPQSRAIPGPPRRVKAANPISFDRRIIGFQPRRCPALYSGLEIRQPEVALAGIRRFDRDLGPRAVMGSFIGAEYSGVAPKRPGSVALDSRPRPDRGDDMRRARVRTSMRSRGSAPHTSTRSVPVGRAWLPPPGERGGERPLVSYPCHLDDLCTVGRRAGVSVTRWTKKPALEGPWSYDGNVSADTISDPDCLDEPTVLVYLAGTLDEADRLVAEAHIDGCGSCLALVAALGRGRASETSSGRELRAERYEVRREIASGGMGQVFEAYDGVLGRNVALKCVRPGSENRAAARRFQREMALTARLQHPSIIPVYDAGRFPDGSRYFAMRLVEGQPLDVAIANANTMAERLALVPVVRRVCEAAAYAHQQSVIHRDLKPANVLIGPFGETVVLDWGLAKDLEETSGDSQGESMNPDVAMDEGATRPGAVMGTAGYIAPEVARGEMADTRADVFSLGMVLHKVLSRASEGPSEAGQGARSFGEATADLGAIVECATADDPSDRYSTAGELCEDLRRFEAGQTVAARDYSLRHRARRFVRRHRLPVGLGAFVIVFSVLAGAWAIAGVVAARDRAQTAQARAETQRELELERRIAAQKLIGFIVDDLQKSLRTIGRADLLVDIAKTVLGYFDDLGADAQVRDTVDLLQEAKMLHGLGDALINSEQRDEAQRAYRAAAARARSAAKKHPREARWWELSARERSAFLLSATDVDAKRAALQEVVDEADRAIAEVEDPVRWVDILAPALANLYSLEQSVGNVTESTKALERMESLPDNPVGPPEAWRKATVGIRLGALQYRAREARDASDWESYRAFTEAIVKEARRQHQAEPDNASGQGNLVAALQEHASACSYEGDIEGETRALEEALEWAEAATKWNPTDVRWSETLGLTLQLLGRNQRSAGELDAAAESYVRAEAIASQVRKAAPNDVHQLRTQSASAGKYGCLVERERGRFDAALAACERSLEALDYAFSLEPEHRHRDHDVGSVAELAALAALGAERLDVAQAHAQRAVAAARAVLSRNVGASEQLRLVRALRTRAAVAQARNEGADFEAAHAEATGLLELARAQGDAAEVAELTESLQKLAEVGLPRPSATP